MTGTLFKFNEFSGEQVARHFDLAPTNLSDRAAMNYMFRTMRDEIPARDREGLKEVANVTIEKIEFRYHVYREFFDDFFLGSPIEQDALALAVICDEYVNHINEPLASAAEDDNDDEEAEIPHRNDGFPEDVATLACTFWEDACAFEAGSTRGQEDQYPPESLYLAHIHVLENLRDHEQRRDDYELDEIREIVEVDLPNARAFVRTDTEIGRHLMRFIDYTEQELSLALRPDPEPRPLQRPILRLVSPPPTPEAP